MHRRSFVLAVVGVAATLLFGRLGLWQLDRREQRRAINAVVAERRDAAPLPFDTARVDSARRRFRRVTITGTLDYDHEFVLTNRTRRGSPGVHLFTPLRRPGSDTAVLVNRGWVYSPDGRSVETGDWRERDTLRAGGYLDEFAPPADTPPAVGGDARILRRLDYAHVAGTLPYPVAPVIVVVTAADSSPTAPVRVEPPPLDEGPHLGYALQWFAFAAIAIVGSVILLRAERTRHRPAAPSPPSSER